MRVICTAGHVDHGKSALVRALTGMEPDRFAEEQRRGLTIDLGFAWAELAGHGLSETVAFVDLPGHERFIGNMLAGAGAVDTVLLVVAADEGWMPQTQEHLEILDLLGVSRGVVALTKVDAVPPGTVAAAVAQVRGALRGSALAELDVVPVSALTGAGTDVLVAQLLAVLESAPRAEDRGAARLWVDRAFTVRGAGTVVTGTLAGGRLAVGQDVEVLPAGRRGRIRGLQELGVPVETAAPGSRVALNLSGVALDEVARGCAIAAPGACRSAHAADAWVRPLPGHELGRRGAWHLHAGSGRWPVQLRPVEQHPVRDPVAGGFVRLELSATVPLVAGDRFVLRDAGRRATAGGGLVLDAAPLLPARGAERRRERREQLARRATALAVAPRGDRAGLLALHVRERGAAAAAEAAAAVGLSPAAAQQAARAARLLPLGTAWVSPEAAGRWSAAVEQALRAHHAAHPVERSAPKDVAVRAATGAGCPPALTTALLDLLVRLQRIVADGPGLRTREHTVVLDAGQAAARDALLARLGAQPFRPPRLAEAAAAAGASTALVRELEAAGRILRVATDLAFTAEAVERAVVLLRAGYEAEGPLTAARAKELLGTSRKFALPLLEALDSRGRSRRVGDTRVILG